MSIRNRFNSETHVYAYIERPTHERVKAIAKAHGMSVTDTYTLIIQNVETPEEEKRRILRHKGRRS